MLPRRYCSCARGLYEAHCAERGVIPISPPKGCGACRDGRVPGRAAVFPPSVAGAVEAARREGTQTARPFASDGSPIIFGLLLGAEFDGSGPGRIDLSLRVPGGPDVGFYVARAIPRAVAIERMHAGLSHYRRVLSGSVEVGLLLALHEARCRLTCWRGEPGALPGPHADPALVRVSPWWDHDGTLGELLYPDTGDAS